MESDCSLVRAGCPPCSTTKVWRKCLEIFSAAAPAKAELPKPWLPLFITVVLLFGSIGGNAYLALMARDFYSRYRALAAECSKTECAHDPGLASIGLVDRRLGDVGVGCDRLDGRRGVAVLVEPRERGIEQDVVRVT